MSSRAHVHAESWASAETAVWGGASAFLRLRHEWRCWLDPACGPNNMGTSTRVRHHSTLSEHSQGSPKAQLREGEQWQ